MSTLESVSCQEISLKNEQQIWPMLLTSLKDCHFVALDFEFSGIGSKGNFKIANIEDRYRAIAEAAKTYAVLSVGVSFFRLSKKRTELADEMCKTLTYNVHNYNIFTCCFDEYEKDEEAVKFLASHGFDFERQTSEGLPYCKGNDIEEDSAVNNNSIRSFFVELIKRKIPIVVHNGFTDLIFMYQNFYCQLPNTLQTFLCDLKEMFSAGIYDTKYIAEYADRMKSSFLEYVFHENQIRNMGKKAAYAPYVELTFNWKENDPNYFLIRNLKTIIGLKKPEGVITCKNYSNHGWCRKGTSCPQSHDINIILSESKGMKKKIKALRSVNDTNVTHVENEKEDNLEEKAEEMQSEVNPMNVKQGLHSSGFDAFMTGFCFAVNHAIHGESNIDETCKYAASKLKMKNFVFNLYLTGKYQPLKVAASNFSKSSVNHTRKMSRIMKR